MHRMYIHMVFEQERCSIYFGSFVLRMDDAWLLGLSNLANNSVTSVWRNDTHIILANTLFGVNS